MVHSKRKPAAPDLEANFRLMPASAAAPTKALPNIPAAKARQSAAAIVTQSEAPPPACTRHSCSGRVGNEIRATSNCVASRIGSWRKAEKMSR